MKTLLAIGALLIAWTAAPAAQPSDGNEIPRDVWGRPSLEGVWNFSSDIPLERPERFGEREFMTAEEVAELRARLAASDAASDEAIPGLGGPGGYNDFWVERAGITDHIRTSHIVYPANGRLPAPLDGVDTVAGGLLEDVPGERPVRFVVGGIGTDGPEDRGLSERCLVGFNAGPPFIPSLYNNNVQIVQSRDHVAIITEMVHDARIAPIGDRPPLDDRIGLWSGSSRGHWDGDTLVVETRNFNGLTKSFGSFGTSAHKVLTERFTRIDRDTVEYEWTLDDPATFADRFTAIVPLTRVAGEMYEYACHEGNYGMENILRGARAEDRAEQEGR